MPSPARKFCVYCKAEDVNDATFRYVDVLRRGLRAAGYEDLGVSDSDSVLRQADDVLTISCLAAMRAIVKHPRARLLHWFQGIEAVERGYLHGGVGGMGRYLLWSVMERIVLRRAALRFFVSEEMRTYYESRPRQTRPALVVPCYNASLDSGPWLPASRYQRLDLVYAGSLYHWQCVEAVLHSYKALRALRADASLSLFTRDVTLARTMCNALGLPDVHIESASPEELVVALRRFSYGFILREHMDINHVSTPTKLSTYLAAGVIPVLTTATPALNRILRDTPYKVTVDDASAYQEIANGILQLADSAPSVDEVRSSYARIFAQHFNDQHHIERVADALRALDASP